MNVKPYDLRRRLYIIMRGEEGLDYGGIARWDKSSVPEQRGFPSQGPEIILTCVFNVGDCGGVGFHNFASLFLFFRKMLKICTNCKVCWFETFFCFEGLCVNHGCIAEAWLWITFTPRHVHPTLSPLSSLPHSITTFIHHMYPSSPCFYFIPGSSFLYMSFFFPVGSGLMFFPLWFCIVSLSLVSRQWFYPMVGDIMLFYHRVEPRTGCWRVSASIRQSIPTSFHKPQNRGVQGALGSGDGARGVAAGGPSISLTCIRLSVFVYFILPCVRITHFMCCHIICASKCG